MARNTRPHPAQKRYPSELRERAVRIVLETMEQTGERVGVITRIACQLGVGSESLRTWVRQAELDGGRRPGVPTAERQRIATRGSIPDQPVTSTEPITSKHAKDAAIIRRCFLSVKLWLASSRLTEIYLANYGECSSYEKDDKGYLRNSILYYHFTFP